MTPKDDRVYLGHIREAIDRIREYTKGGAEVFKSDIKTQDAVYRNFEVIGEDIKRISEDLKSRHPNVDWRKATAMRDVLVHDYAVIDVQTIWSTVERDLPKLAASLEEVKPVN